jgi:hypothetical protein
MDLHNSISRLAIAFRWRHLTLPAPLAATPATAAPGDPCTIRVTGSLSLDVPGTVSANGENCVPNTLLSGPLESLNVGAECGYAGIGPLGPIIFIEVLCPV